MTAMTSAGATLGISATRPAAVSAGGYYALDFTPIAQVTDGGQLGRVYNMVTHSPLAERGVQKLKGSFDDGTVNVVLAYAPGDEGQEMLDVAVDDDDFYAFEYTLQDGTLIWFEAQASSAPVSIGGVDSITGLTAALAVKSGTIRSLVAGSHLPGGDGSLDFSNPENSGWA
jgi:hypothetical protein